MSEVEQLPEKWRGRIKDTRTDDEYQLGLEAAYEGAADELEQALARDRAAQGEALLVSRQWLAGLAWDADKLFDKDLRASLAGIRRAIDERLAQEDRPPVAGDAEPEAPRPMETAPRDCTMVRLLVQFDDHATEDTAGPAWTIGSCNDDNVPDDQRIGWQFAGWCWTHDHFTEGKGTPIGWLPMVGQTPPAGDAQARVDALIEAAEFIELDKGPEATEHAQNLRRIAALQEKQR